MKHSSKQVVIIDTNILCIWLQVPGKETAENSSLTPSDVEKKIKEYEEENAKLILPLAAIIETGNFIAKAKDDPNRFERAKTLVELIRKSADNESPWTVFSEQTSLWSAKELPNLITNWPSAAVEGLSIGDFSILEIAKKYREEFEDVTIYTEDNQLKAHAPLPPAHSITTNSRRRR